MDDEDIRLLQKRDWMEGQIEKAMRRRKYGRLPPDHPLADAEDLPHWWQRWLVEAVGVTVLVAIILAVAVASTYIPPISPLLDRLATAF